MPRSLSLLACACALAACSQPSAPEGARPATAKPAQPVAAGGQAHKAAPDHTRLTVYSGGYEALTDNAPAHGLPGYALVTRPLLYTLAAGRNTISATSLPPSIDAEAAALRPLSDNATVLSQRYVGAVAATGDVIAQAVGERITVEHTSGGAKQTDTGVLLAADEGLALLLADGRVKMIHDYDSFSLLDGASLLPQQATLQWTVDAEAAGDARFLLSYPMGGMAWRAEYLATLAGGDDCRLDLGGAALVANRSGVSFTDARLTLVAGEPNRVRQDTPEYFAASRAADAVAAAPPAPPVPLQRRSGEYHAYELPGSTRVVSGAVERVPLFVQRPAVACERSYVVDADAPDWQPPQPLVAPGYRGQTGTLPVTTTVSVPNTEEAGLGQPLPAGRVRVFEGRDFLGESRLPHTAAGGEIRLEVGTAFDLAAERESTAFRLDRAGRSLTESFAIELRNAKAQPATVRVIEPLPRWSDWEIVDSSVPGKKLDARHVEFDVPVPAGGSSRLTYTVRYRWPEGVTP